MLYFDIKPTKRQARARFENALCTLRSTEVTKIWVKGLPTIYYVNGDQLIFLTEDQYKRYCVGATYKIVGEDGVYHSGYRIAEADDDHSDS